MIEIISATRLSQNDFWHKSALGLSLRRLNDNRLIPQIAFENSAGLPGIYNKRIAAGDDHPILVFMHDDVWIDDYFLVDRIIAGLQIYDIIGVAGNRRRIPNQQGWAFTDIVGNQPVWDDKANLSGAVAHGQGPFGTIYTYGTVPAEVELLDGVFLATKKAALIEKAVAFDPQFDFHFYDMDFSRTARKQGLKMGTWPICLTHQSGGIGNQDWWKSYRTYLDKWKE